MIYTVGIKENYDKYLEEFPGLEKEVGGSVWEFPELAARYIKNINYIARKPYEVYGIEADWEFDTEIVKNCLSSPTFRSLKKRAKIIKL